MTLAHFRRYHEGVPWHEWFAWYPVIVTTWAGSTMWGFRRRLAWLETVRWQYTPCCGKRYQELPR